MTQTAYGQTDALALAIVSWLTTNAGTFCIPIEAERRFLILTDLKDIPDHNEPASVDVFPAVEDSERQGISTAFSSHYSVHVFIQQQVGAASDPEAQCGLLDQLRSEIVEGVKLRYFQLTNAVSPVQNVFLFQVRNADRGQHGPELYNLKRLVDNQVYETDTILVFKAAV